MKVGNQILVDKYLGLPLGYVLNVFVRLAGKILFINHNLDREFKRIAVVKFKGMGSIIQCRPMLQALRDNYPETRLTFISSIQNKGIVEELDMIDDAIFLNDNSFFQLIIHSPGFILKMMSRRFQLLFDLEVYSNLSSIICTCSLATNRFGYFLRSSQYRLGLYSHMIYFNTRIPLSLTYFQLLRALPIKESDVETQAFISAEPQFPNLKKSYILINPNASELRIERRWSGKNFALLIDSLQERYVDFQIVLIGSKSERNYVESISSELRSGPDSVLNLAGNTTIKELISLISSARVFISCDTGPAHIAFTQKTNSVVLFGPVNPEQFEIPSNVKVIYKNLFCSPCVHEFDIPPCLGDNQCMKMINVNEVIAAVDEVMKDDFSKTSGNSFRFDDTNGKALGFVGR